MYERVCLYIYTIETLKRSLYLVYMEYIESWGRQHML